MNFKFQKAARVVKRLIDIILADALLVLLSPVFAIIALAIKITSPGPVLFQWHVVGQGGRPFVGYKFRTMVQDADKMRERFSDDNEMTGPFFKMRHDPRVTAVGAILRKFSLDELPQLWSVLKGDMSLVGPRPTQDFEYERLEEWQRQRIRVKPGCTSLWIVSGKSSDFDEMVNLDLEYINNWSLRMDVNILLKSILYMVFGKNY